MEIVNCLSLLILYYPVTILSQAADNFALLSGTLKTFQAHACDGEELRLNCTENTVISINFVQYGRPGQSGNICPPENVEYLTYAKITNATTCLSNKALKTIEERCRGQRLCRLLTSPETFYDDPCPNQRKYAEVAYKCRPANFVNKIVCEGSRLKLVCPDNLRISIYSATFGTTASGVLECPQRKGIEEEECQVSYATETVVRTCSGLPECSIEASTDVFGSPNCAVKKLKHLKLTYLCVDKDILNRLPSHKGEEKDVIYATSYPAWAGGVDHSTLYGYQSYSPQMKVASTPASSFNFEMQSDEVPTENQDENGLRNSKLIGFMSKWISAYKYVSLNKDKLILYVAVTIGVGFLLFVTILLVRFIILRTGSRHSSKITITPDTDDQFFSDSDMEHYDPPERIASINHAASSLKRQDSDTQPRAPVSTGAEPNHYFS